ncbi:HD family phosphohydrolase [Bacillaceae bacterium YX66]
MKSKWTSIVNRFSFQKNEGFLTALFYLLIALIMYGSLIQSVLPEKMDISLYSVAERDIASPVTIENKQATLQKQNEAAEAVEPEYTNKVETTQTQVEKVEDFFASIAKVNEVNASEEDDGAVEEKSLDEKLTELKEMLVSSAINELSDDTLQAFLTTSSTQLAISKDVIITSVKNVLNERITVEELNQAKDNVEEQIQKANLNSSVREPSIELARAVIIPNFFIDTEATKVKREKAIESVTPVMIRQGQIIVQEGQVINREALEQLEVVGLLDEHFNLYPLVGLAILVVVLTGFLAYFIQERGFTQLNRNRYNVMYLTIFSITIIVFKLVSLSAGLTSGIHYVLPAAMGTMLIKLLISERLALASALVFAVVGSILFNTDTVGIFNGEFGLYILVSSNAAIFLLGRHNHRSKILKTGLFVSLINIVAIIMIYMLRMGQFDWIDLGVYSGYAVISGFLSAVLTLGLMPFFEAAFRILSTMKLIELSNPNHPLLRKLLMEAPGTYHHSVMVANLAEAACEAVGANGLLARVGSYYHDVGKTKRPNFFIENQMNMENPHDKIAPLLSKKIIVAHAYDGADMLREHRLPKEIVDIAEQHHGTTLLKYFYHKANEQSEQPIPEEDYRYPGPRAQTKEAAIVGIADGVEAAVRSIPKPTPAKIESIVRKIINDRLEDGQFNESDLTFKELDTVAKTICETLQGIFHSRIEYPEDLKKKVTK